MVHRRAVLAALALPCAVGCYSYTPVQPGEVRPGVTVRARVNPIASASIAPLLGTTPRVLTGAVISSASDTVVVEVPSVQQAAIGSSVQTLHQRVALARNDVVIWEIRELDRRRTYAAVGGAAALVAVVLFKAFKGEPGSERIPGDGGTDARVPLFRFSR